MHSAPVRLATPRKGYTMKTNTLTPELLHKMDASGGTAAQQIKVDLYPIAEPLRAACRQQDPCERHRGEQQGRQVQN